MPTRQHFLRGLQFSSLQRPASQRRNRFARLGILIAVALALVLMMRGILAAWKPSELGLLAQISEDVRTIKNALVERPKPPGPNPTTSPPTTLVPPRRRQELQPTIKPIFKNSPLLTEQRKRRLTREINEFYAYLVNLGFDLPKEMPPLGVSQPGKPGSAAWVSPGSYLDEVINLPADSIDKPHEVVYWYGHWVFSKLFPGPEYTDVALLYTFYYKSSFSNEYPFTGATEFGKWNKTLWEIRAKYGQDFTDRAMFYTYKRWYPPKSPQTFDELFFPRFRAGLEVVHNTRGYGDAGLDRIFTENKVLPTNQP